MEFTDAIEQKVSALVLQYAGASVNPTYGVKATGDYLRDFDIDTESPFAVVTCRSAEPTAQEIGSSAASKAWTVHIYFLAVNKSWTEGKKARNFITNQVWRGLDANTLLDSFTFTSPDGETDQVWSTQVESVTFDGSGEDGYYTFVTEMHLRVDTSTS